MFKIYINHLWLTIHSPFSSCLKTWTKNKSSVETDLISSLLWTPIWILEKVTLKVRETTRICLLFGSLVCSTFTCSTEPLPGMAQDDNDFALYAGQLSLSKDACQPMSQMQTAPALERVLVASVQGGRLRSHYKPQLKPPVFWGQRRVKSCVHCARACTPASTHTGAPLILCWNISQHHLDLPHDKPALCD